MFQLAVQREIELPQQLRGALVIPGRIERLQIRHEVLHGHPVRHLLVFRDVADLREIVGIEPAGVAAEDFRQARRGLDQVHQQLDRGRLAGSIWAHQGEDAALRHGHVHAVQDHRLAESLGKIDRS